MPRKPYSGHLAKPIPDLSWTDEELKDVLCAQLERLFDHYEIPEGPDKWMYLAYELACEDGGVPGFQFAKPLGAPPYPPDDDYTILRTLDDAKKKGESIAQAARDLADWGAAEGRLRGLPAEQIRVRYYHLKRDLNALERMLAYHQAELVRLKRIEADYEAAILRTGLKVIEGKRYRITVSDDGRVQSEKLL